MAYQPKTRQELYDRIRQSSKDEVILDEMIRLGFWPKQGTMPKDPADEIRRRAELQRRVNDLRTKNRNLHNEAALLAELRKQRLAESKRKQKENKERRERERKERAEAWKQKQQKEIIYLGKSVSEGLSNKGSDVDKLADQKLPVFHNAAELASAMNISVPSLRFLAFSRKVSTVSHYQRFFLPKKTGGTRKISAPMPRLKASQTWILENILEKLPIHETAHGFVKTRSIVSNASPHIGKKVVINLDLKDFFPSVSYPRVKGLFRSFGYAENIATILGLLCTEPDVEEIELDQKRYFVAIGTRFLPQGAPTSPYITNLLCRDLDYVLFDLAREFAFQYTRYADDLSFSGQNTKAIGKILQETKKFVINAGFEVHPDKTRVFRHGSRQEVTGLVVNKKVAVSKKTLKRFRATLFQIEKDGPKDKRWGNSTDVIAAIQGFANFIYMVQPEKGKVFKNRVQAIIDQYGWTPKKTEKKSRPKEESLKTTPQPNEKTSPAEDSEKTPKDKKWWKLW